MRLRADKDAKVHKDASTRLRADTDAKVVKGRWKVRLRLADT